MFGENVSLSILNNDKSLRNDNGVHYERIKALIPDAIKQAPMHRLASLKKEVAIAESYRSLSPGDRTLLKQSLLTHWQLQGVLDSTLKGLEQDIQGFARPLLAQAIKSELGVDLDVDTTTLKLYVPDKIIFGIDRGASRARHTSLLEAALHNFEEPETEDDAFRTGSGVYTPDETGAPRLHTVTTGQFTALCRKLDIGAQYQAHIKALLTPSDEKEKEALRQQSIAVENSTLEVAVAIAGMTSDIGRHGQAVLKDVLSGKKDIQYNGQPLHAHRLSLFGLKLSGVVLFSAVAQKNEIQKFLLGFLPEELQFLFDWSRRIPGLNDNLYEKYKVVSDVFANGPGAVTEEVSRRNDFYDQSRLTGPLIAYVPDDPVHLLKEYASLTVFMKELITQLLDNSYQQYFSRFVAQKDKPKFFKRVNERLKEITWHQREPLSMGPWWRETPVENPDAEPITVPIAVNLWEYLYREKRDKAIADARLIAVPTGDEDAKTRWNRLVGYLDIGWNIFNFGVMLVPGMGEVVLGVMVAQLMAEFAEGIEDWSKGDKDEASAHINSVIINFAQLAMMSAGHILPSGAAAIKPSPFVDNLKPVSMPDGATRLWNPDLTVYEHKTPLPKGSRPDDLGLHQHQGKQVLRLEDKQYVVKEDAQTSRHHLQHPTRADAYAPLVEHNSAGAWKTELERPIDWQKAQLLRRLNPLASTFSETTLEQVLNVSGIEEDVLRRLHVEHELPPPLLTDTLNRFDLYARTRQLGDQVRNGVIDENLAGYLPGLMTELPRWPESRAITLYDPLPAGRESVTYGNASATPANTLTVTLDELKAGKLESRVLESLDEPETEGLLGNAISTDKAVRLKALREELAARADKRKARIFESQYKGSDESSDAQVGRLQGDYPDLPKNVVEQLLKDADPQDLRFLKEKGRTPLKLRQQIRVARNKVRLTRAYEGLYLDQLENVDTRRLELCSVQNLPGWSPNVRIEIRELSFTGKVQASVGPEGASIRKVLILDEDGRYNARDETEQHLHGADDFYSSLLHALPDAERQALGYEVFEGDKLRAAVQRSPLAHEPFEQVLLDNPVRKPAYDPEHMRLRGGMQGYPLRRPGWRALQERLSSLYPTFTEEEVESTLNGFGVGMAEQRVTALEDEFNALNRSFQRWMNSPTQAFRFSPQGVAEWESRNKVYKTIRQCWQRTGPQGIEAHGVIRPQALILDGSPLDQHLSGMPLLSANNFDHVTVLSLRKGRLLTRQQHFLAPFRQLRRLNMTGNRLGNARQPIWDTVEDEFGSEPFFKEVRKLTQSADFKATDVSYKTDLTAKVWRMLKAMEENTALREKIFGEAVVSTTCADAGAQFFNAVGVEVLVHEAYSLASTDLVEAELVSLARGKSRLDELGAIARRRVADRLQAGETFRRQNGDVVTGTIDEVEVHLAYMTDLAERLDLPWQSRGMLFRNRIQLTGETAQLLAGRTTLRALNLGSNPLRRLPDFSQMTDMRSLYLASGEIDTWPTGLGGQPLLDTIYLRDNQFTVLPESIVNPAAGQLERVARLNNMTYIDGNPLTPATQQQLNQYWARIERERPDLLVLRKPGAFEYRAPRVPAERVILRSREQTGLQRWSQDMAADQLTTRQNQWQTLFRAPGSDGFFRVLNDLEGAAAGHEDLQQRVWAVIDAITEAKPESETLREEMFDWAGRPACCDRAALSFSNLEIMAMVYRANALEAGGENAASLLKLSRGLFRLEEVEKIALADITRRTAAINNTVGLSAELKAERIASLEDVEIKLAYRYGLKDRLKLPGQPQRVRFTGMAEVKPEMLQQAYAKVVALDGSPEEFQSLVDKEFWKNFLTKSYRPQFESLREPYVVRQEALRDRHMAGELTESQYLSQSEDLHAQLQIEEAGLISKLTRAERVKHPF